MGWVGKILRTIGRHVRTTLVAGVLIIIPIVVTFVIVKFVFDFFDPLLKPLFEQFTDRYVRGMGIAALVVIVYIAGLVTTHVLGRRLIELGHSLVDQIPVVRGVYRAARQATQVFSTVNTNGNSGGVVLVDFPGNGLRSIGLVTGRLKDQHGNELVAVYMPTSPFPTSGFLIIMPEDRLTPTDLAVDDAMKLIVSAGVLSPERIEYSPSILEGVTATDLRRGQTPDNRASNQ